MQSIRFNRVAGIATLSGMILISTACAGGHPVAAPGGLSGGLRGTVLAAPRPGLLSAHFAQAPDGAPQPAGGGMMGSSDSGMMSGGGMMGGSSGSGMMSGGGTSGMDMGQMLGSMMANAPGDRVSQAQADTFGSASPAGASVDQTNNQISFQTQDVQLAVLSSPDNGPDMTFRVAGLADPTIVIPTGAHVTLQFIQSDKDTSHGWLLTASQPPFSSMAMMDTAPAFAGSSAMPLGDPTDAGVHSETISFTAGAAGQYTYLCPVMGHAQQGMYGTFIVQ